MYFTGPAAAAQSAATLRAAAAPNSLAAFKRANGLADAPFANALRLELPHSGWQRGASRQLYLYHQLAYGGQQLFLQVPRAGAGCTGGSGGAGGGAVAVTALTDNSAAVKYEVILTAIACRDVAKGERLVVPLAVGAPSA